MNAPASCSPLRQLALDYAAGNLDREAYLAARRVMLDALDAHPAFSDAPLATDDTGGTIAVADPGAAVAGGAAAPAAMPVAARRRRWWPWVGGGLALGLAVLAGAVLLWPLVPSPSPRLNAPPAPAGATAADAQATRAEPGLATESEPAPATPVAEPTREATAAPDPGSDPGSDLGPDPGPDLGSLLTAGPESSADMLERLLMVAAPDDPCTRDATRRARAAVYRCRDPFGGGSAEGLDLRVIPALTPFAISDRPQNLEVWCQRFPVACPAPVDARAAAYGVWIGQKSGRTYRPASAAELAAAAAYGMHLSTGDDSLIYLVRDLERPASKVESEWLNHWWRQFHRAGDRAGG